MQIFLVLFVLMIGASAPVTAFADEFGERFYSKAPSGLGDYTAEENDEIPDIAMDDIAKSLQDIMPASGDEYDIDESTGEIPSKSEEETVSE